MFYLCTIINDNILIMEFRVCFIEQITRDGEVQGGDEQTLKVFKTKDAAIRYGKKRSFEKTFNNGTCIVHEVYIQAYDEKNDDNYIWFIKDGVITHSDVG